MNTFFKPVKNSLVTISLLFTIHCSLFTLLSCSFNKNKSDAYGTFETTEVTVSSEATGKIIKLDIEEGQILKANLIVGIIDTVDLTLKKRQLIAQKEQSAAKSENISSLIEVQKQQKDNFLIDKDRIEKLLKDNAATTKQLDDVNGSIRLVDKQILSIETQKIALTNEIEAYTQEIAQVEESIRKSYIRSPIDGTVLTKYAEAGEFATVGKALYKIADIKEMYLRVYVSETQLPNIKIGQKTEVLIDTDKDNMKKLEGTVSWISETAEFTPKIIQTKEDRVNLVYAIKILVINDGSLKIGMPGEANFK